MGPLPLVVCEAVLTGRTRGLLEGPRRLKMVAGHLGESAMQALSKLVGGILTLGTTLSGDDHAGRGHPGETGESDQLPAHAHSCVG
jgi:hypothetical protein